MDSCTPVIVPFDNRVVSVRPLHCAQFSSGLSEVAQLLDPIPWIDFAFDGLRRNQRLLARSESGAAPGIKELKPKLPILMLYNGYDPTEAKVDGSLHSLETPEAMLDMIGFMTRNVGDPLPV